MGWYGGWYSGRINRATYWPCLGGLLVLLAIMGAMQLRGSFGEILLFFISAPRLHDLGKSAWWAGGVILAEFAVAAASIILLPREMTMIPLGLFVIVALGLLILLGILPGQPGSNKYGPPSPAGFTFSRMRKSDEPDPADVEAF